MRIHVSLTRMRVSNRSAIPESPPEEPEAEDQGVSRGSKDPDGFSAEIGDAVTTRNAMDSTGELLCRLRQ